MPDAENETETLPGGNLDKLENFWNITSNLFENGISSLLVPENRKKNGQA